MRIPEDVVWNREIVYNCVWWMLITLEQHNRVWHWLLGTLSMPPKTQESGAAWNGMKQ